MTNISVYLFYMKHLRCMKKLTFILASISIFSFISCGGNDKKSPQALAAEKSNSSPENANATTVIGNKITIESNDQMMYNLKTIESKAGEKIEITLINKGTMPKESMGHNWCLLAQGVNVEAFATAAATSKNNDYIPKDLEKNVIAHTKILGPGESETITFDAPTPGTYKFICSFPGHYMMMQGDLIVK